MKILRPLVFSFLFLSSYAFASDELDRLYALDKIGALKSVDNVDGVFQETVAAVFKHYFIRQSRFVPVDLDEANRMFKKSKIPYDKLIEDNDVLHEMARSVRADSLVRTQIYKEPGRYRFKFDWIHSAKMDVLGSETGVLQEPKTGTFVVNEAELSRFMAPVLNKLFAKVPFIGQVTGRDVQMVTLNVGANAGLEMGDTIWISSIQEVKKHPLLKTIEGWEFDAIGRAEVQQVDDGIAFAKVFQEDAKNPIKRFHKIIRVEKKPDMTPEAPIVERDPVTNEVVERKKKDEKKPEYLQGDPPRLGWVGVGPWVGGLSREYNPYSGTGTTGGGMTLGGLADAQIWINREFFVSSALGYGFWNHTQTNVGSAASSSTGTATGTMMMSRLGVGYSHFLKEDFFGPKGWVKASYQNHSYSLPSRTADFLAAASVSSLAIGIGGDIPLREGWGLMMNLDVGVLNSGDAKDLGSGDVDGTSQLDFLFGVYSRISSDMAIRGSFDMWGDTITFVNGNSLSHRVISFSPSVVFFF